MSPTDVKIEQVFCRSNHKECQRCGNMIPPNHQLYQYEATYPQKDNAVDNGAVCTSCAQSKEDVRVIYLYELAEKKHGR